MIFIETLRNYMYVTYRPNEDIQQTLVDSTRRFFGNTNWFSIFILLVDIYFFAPHSFFLVNVVCRWDGSF
jgi:hypothetical protein